MLLKKLVIAEDDDAIAHLVAAGLGDAGYLCLRARDGDEALAMARAELPDALLLDVMMPRVDGIEVCRRLKADVLLSQIPIMLLTSLADVEERVAGLDAGADDYLPKPFDLRELNARVKALIRQSRRERDRNPTTGLPGAEAIEDHVAALLKAGEHFVLLYADIDNYRTYADVYGYRKADEVIAQMGKLLLAQARASSDPMPFVGHIGGDDFIVVCRPAQQQSFCDEFTADFVASVGDFYDERDRERGYVEREEAGNTRRAQLMSAAVVALDVKAGSYDSLDALAKALTRAKAAAH
ncbi:MAG: response regulator [Deltaproteobacteria bacterium]|nr:response regulator [Deltaproteobacteria bacterium]